MTLTFAIAWFFGHLLGYVLLGIALARARVIPLWAASLIIVSAPMIEQDRRSFFHFNML
jgi:hypothetical protein